MGDYGNDDTLAHVLVVREREREGERWGGGWTGYKRRKRRKNTERWESSDKMKHETQRESSSRHSSVLAQGSGIWVRLCVSWCLGVLSVSERQRRNLRSDWGCLGRLGAGYDCKVSKGKYILKKFSFTHIKLELPLPPRVSLMQHVSLCLFWRLLRSTPNFCVRN